jgi:hypothetical protein
VLTVIQTADPLLDLVADLRTAGWCRSCQQNVLNGWVRMIVLADVGPGDSLTLAGYVRTWTRTALGCFADGCPRKVNLR